MTPQGRILISNITNVEAAVDAVQRKVASFDSKALGPVKVTCLVIVGQRIIKSGLLDAFHAQNPGISIELLMEQSILDLSKGEADIAIRGGKPGSGALVCRKIADVPWAIYASRAFYMAAPLSRPTLRAFRLSIWWMSWKTCPSFAGCGCTRLKQTSQGSACASLSRSCYPGRWGSLARNQKVVGSDC